MKLILKSGYQFRDLVYVSAVYIVSHGEIDGLGVGNDCLPRGEWTGVELGLVLRGVTSHCAQTE